MPRSETKLSTKEVETNLFCYHETGPFMSTTMVLSLSKVLRSHSLFQVMPRSETKLSTKEVEMNLFVTMKLVPFVYHYGSISFQSSEISLPVSGNVTLWDKALNQRGWNKYFCYHETSTFMSTTMVLSLTKVLRSHSLFQVMPRSETKLSTKEVETNIFVTMKQVPLCLPLWFYLWPKFWDLTPCFR